MKDDALPSTSPNGHLLPATQQSGRTLPPGYIHLGVVKEAVPTLRAFGVDPDPVIREAGLDPRLFEDAANIIPHDALGRLLALCVARTNCAHFGLLVGQRATIQSLGMVGRLMQHSDTVGEAIHALVAHLSIQNRGAVPSLAVKGEVALFTFSVYQSEIESVDQISDGALAVTVNALRAICGSDWNPTEVLLPHAAPADPEPYRRHFRAPVRFNQEAATLVLASQDLTRRVAGADPLLRAMVLERIGAIKEPTALAFADDIRRLLRTHLTHGRLTAEDLAGLLVMHRRTLSRRLKGTGLDYRAVSAEIKFEIARQLLEDTTIALAEIAAALGYSEASAFTRAFRRWSGLSPLEWRTSRRSGPRLPGPDRPPSSDPML
jgi:AraC-like DNA-binding protein